MAKVVTKEIYRSAFTQEDLVSGATVSVIGGQFVRTGEYDTKAGEAVCVGWGGQSGQESAQGRIFMKLMDDQATPVLINGLIRMSIYSPQDRPIEILGEWRTETLYTNETDRTKQISFPEHAAGATEDKKIVLEFKADASATLVKANSKIVMDITRYTV